MPQTLSIKRPVKADAPAATPPADGAAHHMILEAIARRRRLGAIYNRQRVTLAPHILYTRHDEMFVDAVTLDRDDKPPREIKLGSFKVAGLHELALIDEPFDADPGFDATDRRYAGVTLFAV